MDSGGWVLVIATALAGVAVLSGLGGYIVGLKAVYADWAAADKAKLFHGKQSEQERAAALDDIGKRIDELAVAHSNNVAGLQVHYERELAANAAARQEQLAHMQQEQSLRMRREVQLAAERSYSRSLEQRLQVALAGPDLPQPPQDWVSLQDVAAATATLAAAPEPLDWQGEPETLPEPGELARYPWEPLVLTQDPSVHTLAPDAGEIRTSTLSLDGIDVQYWGQ
jgi:hypothetical protein